MRIIFFILCIFLISFNSRASEQIDWSLFRGTTTVFSESLIGKQLNNPSQLVQDESLYINILSIKTAVGNTAVSLLQGIGELDSDPKNLDPLFLGTLNGLGQTVIGFSKNGISLSGFANGEASAKISNPIFPEIKGAIYGDFGGVLGYSKRISEELSVGGAARISYIKGVTINADIIDSLVEVPISGFAGINLESSLGVTYFHKKGLTPNVVFDDTQFTVTVSNLKLYDNLDINVRNPMKVSLGLRKDFEFSAQYAQKITAYSQFDLIRNNLFGGLGLEYFPIKQLGLAFGFSNGELSAGLTSNLSFLNIQIGTYTKEEYYQSKERIYSLGISFFLDQ